MNASADATSALSDEDDASTAPRLPAPLTEEELSRLRLRMEFLDGNDVAIELVHELVEQSLLEADALYVERSLMAYAARDTTTQLFLLVAACTPSVEPNQQALQLVSLPSIRTQEDPAQCVIDAFCRNEINMKSPLPPTPTKPSTPQKTKRLTVTTSLAAAALLASPPSPRGFGLRSAASLKPIQPGTPHKHEPGVPYNVGPPVSASATVSPRKTVALLKAAARLSTSRPTSPFSDGSTDQEGDETLASVEVELDPPPPKLATSPQKRSVNDALSSSSGWLIILPSDPAKLGENDADVSSSVSVEYVLPRRRSVFPELPIGRRGSVAATPHLTPAKAGSDDSRRKPSVFLPRADENEAVEVDAMGMLGYELRARLSLSAGVRMQSEGGDLVQSGPDLPVFATKMRRATFMDESLAHDLVTLSLAQSPSPTRPPQRPSATPGTPSHCSSSSSSLDKSSSSNQSSGVFSLTECPPSGLAKAVSPSMRSLTNSNISTTSTPTTSLKPNLFRKPSKVSRPCTALSPCCNDSGHGACADPESSMVSHADLIKQRAFQRKPSLVNTSPPKKSQSRRSIVSPTTTSTKTGAQTSGGAASSPLSRRSLLTKTSSSSSNHSDDDPLRHAAKIL